MEDRDNIKESDDDELYELPIVLKVAGFKNEDIPIYRYVFCEKYAQELMVNFHYAPISRICLHLKKK